MPGLLLAPYQLTQEEFLRTKAEDGNQAHWERVWADSVKASSRYHLPLHPDVERSWQVAQTPPKDSGLIAQLQYLMAAIRLYSEGETEFDDYVSRLYTLLVDHFKTAYKAELARRGVADPKEKDELLLHLSAALVASVGLLPERSPLPTAKILDAWRVLDQAHKRKAKK